MADADCFYRAAMKVAELRDLEMYEDKEFEAVGPYGKEFFD